MLTFPNFGMPVVRSGDVGELFADVRALNLDVLLGALLLRDSGRITVLSLDRDAQETRHYVYVNNVGVIGSGGRGCRSAEGCRNPRAAAELCALAGLMVFLVGSWELPWNGHVLATDACETGWEICRAAHIAHLWHLSAVSGNAIGVSRLASRHLDRAPYLSRYPKTCTPPGLRDVGRSSIQTR